MESSRDMDSLLASESVRSESDGEVTLYFYELVEINIDYGCQAPGIKLICLCNQPASLFFIALMNFVYRIVSLPLPILFLFVHRMMVGVDYTTVIASGLAKLIPCLKQPRRSCQLAPRPNKIPHLLQ